MALDAGTAQRSGERGAMPKRRRRGASPPEVGDRVSVKYAVWEEGRVTRVEEDEFWVAYDGGKGEYEDPVSITQNV